MEPHKSLGQGRGQGRGSPPLKPHPFRTTFVELVWWQPYMKGSKAMTKKTIQSPLSRRSVIKAMFSGALVVGFHAATGTWVTAAQAAALPEFEQLPPLDGTLYRDEATRAEYG